MFDENYASKPKGKDKYIEPKTKQSLKQNTDRKQSISRIKVTPFLGPYQSHPTPCFKCPDEYTIDSPASIGINHSANRCQLPAILADLPVNWHRLPNSCQYRVMLMHWVSSFVFNFGAL